MTGIFRANNPLNASILFVYGLLLKLVWFIHYPGVIVEKTDGFLYHKVISSLTPAFEAWPLLPSIIAFLLLYSQALTLNYYINSRRLMPHPNYLPAMSYLLITSFFAEWNMISSTLIISSFAIWVWGRLSNLNNGKDAKGTLFNIGFVIGICSFLYLPSVAIALIVIFTLIITRPPRIAEWIMPLLGIATIWYFLFAALFITDDLYQFSIPQIEISRIRLSGDPVVYAGLCMILFMFILGGYFVQAESSKQVIQVRKRWSIMLIFLIVFFLLLFSSEGFHFTHWLLPAIPAIVFASAAFFYLRFKWVRLLLHWSMVGFVVYVQFFKK